MRELVNTYLNKSKPPETIYHYCSIEAFISILENSCIRLTDLSKANDSTEMQWLLTNVKETLNNLLCELKGELNEKLWYETKIFFDRVIGNLKNKKMLMVEYERNFLACFSEKKDLLSQWRAYGNDGKGVAIGFSSDILNRLENSSAYDFAKVTYKKNDINTFLNSALVNPIKQLLTSNSEKNEMFMEMALIIYSIYQEGFVFKNPNYFEEKEWRIFHQITSANYNSKDGVDDYGYLPAMEGVFCDGFEFAGGFTRSRLKYLSTDSDIRMYMELGFEKHKKKIIRKIILGPKCRADELAVRFLLAQNNYIDDITSDKIKIEKSNVPYI